jgi:tetratricopeptide (TPR) repeat protein
MDNQTKVEDILERARLHLNMRKYHVAHDWLKKATYILREASEPIPPEIQELREIIESALIAEEYKDKAVTLLEEEKYTSALTEFERAASLSRDPETFRVVEGLSVLLDAKNIIFRFQKGLIEKDYLPKEAERVQYIIDFTAKITCLNESGLWQYVLEGLSALKSELDKQSSENEKQQRNSKTRILFLAADPTDTSRLRLGEEIREIKENLLQISKQRKRFDLHEQWSVRPQDISQALLDFQPQIIHFSGHGTASGALCFENQMGEMQPVEADALSALFEHFSKHLFCVILNACYSEIQARAIAKHISYVIGMNRAIGDKAAIAFTIGFYQALGAGKNIDEAYKLGCVQIKLQGIPESLTPALIKRKV